MKFDQLKTLDVGTRVLFADSLDIFPICVVPAGTVGVVARQTSDFTAIRPEPAIEDLVDEWNGEIHLSQLHDDEPESPVVLDELSSLKAEQDSMMKFGAAGFEFWETGGGCTAYGAHLGGPLGAHLIVTAADDTQPPMDPNGEIEVGYYDDFENFDGDVERATGFDAAIARANMLIEKHKDDELPDDTR